MRLDAKPPISAWRTFLANNDSYNFFEPLNDLIITGPTKTNVNDVMVMIAA